MSTETGSGCILVTGGAGFIGSAVVRRLITTTDSPIVALDALTYAATRDALATVADSPRFAFAQIDVRDAAAVREVLACYRPRAIVHLAAETHVDRSIDGPMPFVETNVLGTAVLLEAARVLWSGLDAEQRERFRFVHVSTDEVFGSLGSDGRFTETSPYRPSSPYAASKAGSDHLARAWLQTWGLPVMLTYGSNTFGPFQYPEKLIPVIILNAVAGRPLPVYGDGGNVRDWMWVEDHAAAICTVLDAGQPGESYAIGAGNERSNLDVVRSVCALLDEMRPASVHRPHAGLIRLVDDRPGHDRRYALDATKVRHELGWRPVTSFATGLRATVAWYLANPDWCRRALGRGDSATLPPRLGRSRPPATPPAA